MVGHTLYGDVDVGMCNIDITHSRYSGAVDYSAFIRSLSFSAKVCTPQSIYFSIYDDNDDDDDDLMKAE